MSDQNQLNHEEPYHPITRRTVLSASGALGAAGLFGVGSAVANPERGRAQAVVSRHELSENGLGNAQTDTPPFMPRLKTYNGRQYYAYWTHSGELIVAARNLPDGEWEQHEMGIEIDVRDGHWTPAVGIGPEGHVFLNYNTRNSEILWRRSTEPEDITAWSDEHVGMTGENESSVTYMEFTRLRDDTLLEAHREGSSGAGDWIMNRWDPDEEEWEPLQHPLIDGEGEHNSYMWNLVQSDDGTLHYFFNFRETGAVETNVDLSYARSTDGGETWEHSDGTPYDLPITMDETEIVDPIEQNSNFINNGWASYDPRTNEPHVTYYRDDEDGYTQIYHAYRNFDAEEWAIEPTTNRTDDIDLGGGGVVASPIGRMGIVVGDDGDVHILARDYEHGGWPLLIEKLNGEWQTSVLYKRNMTWSDIHIDPERWRQDRVLSYVDHQQNVGDVPWSSQELVAVTDVDLDALDRSNRTVDLSVDWETEPTTYAATGPAEQPLTATTTSFEDTPTALAFSETTVPASPVYARATADVEATDDAEAEIRVKIQGKHGTTFGEPASGGHGERVTTEWTEVPQAFRAGFANLQVRSSTSESTVTLTDVTLELGYADPTAYERTVAPRGSRGADTKPLSHMVPVDATGLREEAPVTTDAGEFEDTPTSLEISRATGTTPVFARVTARMEPYGDALGLDGASWIWYPNDDPAWNVNEPWAEGVRYFRRTFEFDDEPDAARFVVTGDNSATVYVNGEAVGSTDDWTQAPVLDVTEALEAGENTIAIEVERFGYYASLIGRLEATVGDETVTVDTDGSWLAADEVSDGWTDPAFDDSDWPNAQANGEYGMAPWGTNVTIDDDRDAALRLALTDEDGETSEYGDPVMTDNREIRTTGWEAVPPAFNEGTVTLQARDARVTAVMLELAIRNEV